MHNWKSRLKNPTDVDTSKFAKRVDLVNFKSDVDKWDIDKADWKIQQTLIHQNLL